jgi:carboxymethylenebutenolidase
VAPALFDRVTPGFEAGYAAEDIARGRDIAMKNRDWDKIMADTKAAFDEVKAAGPTAIVGFCMGGSVAFLAATRIDGLVASSCFYGGQIVQFADAKPKCPTEMHFGEHDEHIPMSDVDAIKAKRPDCDVFVYPAGHGFYCDERGSYDAPSAKLAWERTLSLFEKATGGAQAKRAGG